MADLTTIFKDALEAERASVAARDPFLLTGQSILEAAPKIDISEGDTSDQFLFAALSGLLGGGLGGLGQARVQDKYANQFAIPLQQALTQENPAEVMAANKKLAHMAPQMQAYQNQQRQQLAQRRLEQLSAASLRNPMERDGVFYGYDTTGNFGALGQVLAGPGGQGDPVWTDEQIAFFDEHLGQDIIESDTKEGATRIMAGLGKEARVKMNQNRRADLADLKHEINQQEKVVYGTKPLQRDGKDLTIDDASIPKLRALQSHFAGQMEALNQILVGYEASGGDLDYFGGNRAAVDASAAMIFSMIRKAPVETGVRLDAGEQQLVNAASSASFGRHGVTGVIWDQLTRGNPTKTAKTIRGILTKVMNKKMSSYNHRVNMEELSSPEAEPFTGGIDAMPITPDGKYRIDHKNKKLIPVR